MASEPHSQSETPPAEQPRPRMSWDMNINTLLTVGGFAITLLTGAMAYQSFKTETEMSRTGIELQIKEIEAQRQDDILRAETRFTLLETSINALNVRDARNDERMTAILNYVQRIDRKLDEGVKP